MPLRSSLLLLVFGTALCWVAWSLVLFNIDPENSGFVGLASFYLSLFLALVGTFALLGFVARRALTDDPVAFRHIGVSMRQGLLFALVVVGALLLRGTRLYTWWSVVLLLAGFTLLEFFFLTREQR